MEFQDVVRKRRMVRNFDTRPVPREAVDRLLDNARRAPSAGYTQGWAFLVLDGPQHTEKFWDATFPDRHQVDFRWPGLFQAPLIIVPLSNKSAYVDRYAEDDKGWSDRDEARWPTPYWHVDTAFAAMAMMLTAVDQDLATLFFGIFKVMEFKSAFQIPDAFHPIGALAIGYPLPDEPSPSLKRGRKAGDEVVHWGQW